MSINQVIIQGRVGKDPEIRRLDNGNAVANFSVATSERWKDKASGEKKEKTEWHRVVVWGDGIVTAIEKYLKKGLLVTVIGQLETRKWSKDGVDHYSTEIIVKGFAHKVEWVETVKREASSRDDPENTGRPSGGGYDDEIPF